MTTAIVSRSTNSNDWTRPVLVGGLTAGALDIIYALSASFLKGGDPSNVLRAIASGIFGRPAFEGGASMAMTGLALHFLMALLIAAIFLAAIRFGLSSLRNYPLLSGPLYGVGIYFVMQQMVLPLSNVPMRDPRPPIDFTGLAVHMFLVGLPIALAAHRWAAPKNGL
jgi:MFS superfamily sulfate permease-like transporter